MVRVWRICVLMLAVLPLAMPVVHRFAASQCKTQMAMDHECCPQHTTVTAPACCDTGADSSWPEIGNAADAMRLLVRSQVQISAPLAELGVAVDICAPRPAYIPILLPTPILRT